MVPQAVKDLKTYANINYNAATFAIETKDAFVILDYIRRLENLHAVESLLIDQAGLSVTCNDCPFIDKCNESGNKTDDCQLRAVMRCKTLGV